MRTVRLYAKETNIDSLCLACIIKSLKGISIALCCFILWSVMINIYLLELIQGFEMVMPDYILGSSFGNTGLFQGFSSAIRCN